MFDSLKHCTNVLIVLLLLITFSLSTLLKYHKPDVTKAIVSSNTVILNTILHISEGKELKLSNNYHNKQLLTSKYITKLPNDCIMIEHSYLIVRLPWCHQIHSSSDLSTINLDQYHSNVAWLSGSCPQYAFTIRSQCLLNQVSMWFLFSPCTNR